MTRVPSPAPPDAAAAAAPASGAVTSGVAAAGPRTPAAPAAPTAAPCPQCGGSGMLRLDDHRYRTCLDCLGQGQLLGTSAGTLFVPRISVAASVSAAG